MAFTDRDRKSLPTMIRPEPPSMAERELAALRRAIDSPTWKYSTAMGLAIIGGCILGAAAILRAPIKDLSETIRVSGDKVSTEMHDYTESTKFNNTLLLTSLLRGSATNIPNNWPDYIMNPMATSFLLQAPPESNVHTNSKTTRSSKK